MTDSVEAHRITIVYGFESDGTEFVIVEADVDMSNILKLGMIELAKNRILNPELYEGDEDADTLG